MSWLSRLETTAAGMPYWFELVANTAIRSTVILLAAFLVAALAYRLSAAVRHFIWVISFVGLLILPLFYTLLPSWSVHVLGWRTDGAASSQPTPDLLTGFSNGNEEDQLAGRNAFVPPTGSVSDPSDRGFNTAAREMTDSESVLFGLSGLSGWKIVGLVWTVGAFVALLPFLIGLARRHRLERTSRHPVDDKIDSLARQLSAQMRVSTPITVLEHPDSVLPVVWGIVHVVVLLPAIAVRWSRNRLRVVLFHELAHVKRRDCLIQYLVHVVCAVYWFHPLIWLAARKLRTERENACDDLVLAHGIAPTDYAANLLAIAKTLRADTPETFAAVAMAMPSNLERRLRMILDNNRNRRPLTVVIVSLGLVASVVLLLALATVQLVPAEQKAEEYNPTQVATAQIAQMNVGQGDWPQWGGWTGRNNTPAGQNIPTEWSIGKIDAAGKRVGAKNIKWSARLGSQTYGNPVVANGKVFVGTNNNAGYIKRYPPRVDLGCLLCFDEKTGKFLWQHSNEKLPTGRVHDWPQQGVCAAPFVDGDRLWYVSNRGEVVCLDTEGFNDGENDGVKGEIEAANEADVVWRFDMMGTLGVSQHNMCSCSVTCAGDVLLVNTSNGLDESHINLPAPNAPSFMGLDRNTGTVLWTDKSPGTSILHGQWSSPTYAVLGGQPQALFAGGNGWLYSFDPQGDGQGHAKLLWKFDCNPKDSKWILGGRGTRNNIIATPVVYDGLVYAAVGQDPEHGEGIGHLWCIDPTKRGDVSPELALNSQGKPLPHRRLQAVNTAAGEKAIPNVNEAVVWHYSKWGEDFEQQMHRSCGTVAIKNDLLYISDFSGLFHCLNAKTGQPHWTYDMFASAWGSPLIVEGNVYIGDEDGDVTIFELSSQMEIVREITMGNAVYSTPIIANNVLFIANRSELFAIAPDGK